MISADCRKYRKHGDWCSMLTCECPCHPPAVIRKRKEDCPNCQTLREADWANRWPVGFCGSDCAARPRNAAMDAATGNARD